MHPHSVKLNNYNPRSMRREEIGRLEFHHEERFDQDALYHHVSEVNKTVKEKISLNKRHEDYVSNYIDLFIKEMEALGFIPLTEVEYPI